MAALSISAIVFVLYGSFLVGYRMAKRKTANADWIVFYNCAALYGILLFICELFPIEFVQDKAIDFLPLSFIFAPETAGGLFYGLLKRVCMILLFTPFGFLTSMGGELKGNANFLFTLLLGLLVSASCEFLELLLPFNRICSFDDLICSGLGVMIGVFAFYFPFNSSKRFRIFLRDMLYK